MAAVFLYVVCGGPGSDGGRFCLLFEDNASGRREPGAICGLAGEGRPRLNVMRTVLALSGSAAVVRLWGMFRRCGFRASAGVSWRVSDRRVGG